MNLINGASIDADTVIVGDVDFFLCFMQFIHVGEELVNILLLLFHLFLKLCGLGSKSLYLIFNALFPYIVGDGCLEGKIIVGMNPNTTFGSGRAGHREGISGIVAVKNNTSSLRNNL